MKTTIKTTNMKATVRKEMLNMYAVNSLIAEDRGLENTLALFNPVPETTLGLNSLFSKVEENPLVQLNDLIEILSLNEDKQCLLNIAKKVYNSGNEEAAKVWIGVLNKEVAVSDDITINNNYVVKQIFRKIMLSNSYISQLNIEVASSGKDKTAVDILTNVVNVPRARIHKDVKLENNVTIEVSSGGLVTRNKTHFAPFTYDRIGVHIDDDQKNTYQRIMQDKGLYIVYETSAPTSTLSIKPVVYLYMYDEKIKESVWREQNCSLYEEPKKYTEEEIKELNNAHHYMMLTYSPSGVRTTDAVFKDVTDGDDREEYLNHISHNAFELLKKEINNIKDPKKKNLKIMKSMPRFGQLQAGAVSLGKMTRWVWYHSAFKTANGETMDGTSYLLADFVADCIYKYVGIKVNPNTLVGMLLQIRPEMAKTAAKIVSKDYMLALIKGLEEQENVEYVGKDREIEDMVPQMLLDDNCVKAPFEVQDETELFVLAVANESPANTSKQMLNKAYTKDEEATKKWLFELWQNRIAKKYYTNFFDRKAIVPTIGDINKNYTQDLILSIAPEKILEMPMVVEKQLKTLLEGDMNALNKMKIPTAGKNARLVPEDTELILGKGKSLLKHGEIFSPSAINYMKINKMKEMHIACFKYPTMGKEEYYYAKVVTLKELKKRIRELTDDKELQKLVINELANLKRGVTMTPANRIIMQQCAGLDYDFDGWTEIYEEPDKVEKKANDENYKDLVDILSTDNFTIVDINSSLVKDETINKELIKEEINLCNYQPLSEEDTKVNLTYETRE